MINEEKLINLLFEGNENLVVQNGERFHLEDYIEYFNKPGLIVATIKGVSDYGVQQLPVGAVDSFRFMQITNEDAIINQNKNNGKSYDQILKEYEGEKGGIIDQWKKMNSDKFNGLRSKYGERFLGMDIVENKKKIEHKEEVKKDDDKKDETTNTEKPTKINIMEDEMLEEGFIDWIKNLKADKALKAIADAAEFNETNQIKDSDVKLFVNIKDQLYGGEYPVVTCGISETDDEKINNCLIFIFGDPINKSDEKKMKSVISLETLKMIIKDIHKKQNLSGYKGILVSPSDTSTVYDKVKKMEQKVDEAESTDEPSSDETIKNAEILEVDLKNNTAKAKEVPLDLTRKFLKAKPTYTTADDRNKRIIFYYTATSEQQKDTSRYQNVLRL